MPTRVGVGAQTAGPAGRRPHHMETAGGGAGAADSVGRAPVRALERWAEADRRAWARPAPAAGGSARDVTRCGAVASGLRARPGAPASHHAAMRPQRRARRVVGAARPAARAGRVSLAWARMYERNAFNTARAPPCASNHAAVRSSMGKDTGGAHSINPGVGTLTSGASSVITTGERSAAMRFHRARSLAVGGGNGGSLARRRARGLTGAVVTVLIAAPFGWGRAAGGHDLGAVAALGPGDMQQGVAVAGQRPHGDPAIFAIVFPLIEKLPEARLVLHQYGKPIIKPYPMLAQVGSSLGLIAVVGPGPRHGCGCSSALGAAPVAPPRSAG